MDHFNSKILVIDTDPIFLKIADEKLSARGFKVHLSSSYKESIEILKKKDIRSLLLNIDETYERDALMGWIEAIDTRPAIFYSGHTLPKADEYLKPEFYWPVP